ncbi:MAG TPA: PaaX family transcriptional regulator C-terminal domain-containing protein [bacterium]|nr:PaaX family transcriptional regulator C-terminal domain-containing protein [bacterium]
MQARSTLFTLYGDYVRHYGNTIWVGSMIALLAELGFTSSAVRAAVSRMTRQGWLVPIRYGRASYYSLSERGRERIDEAAQRIFKLHPEPWDGRWRILVVAAPGRDREGRERLRRELTWMGFAPLSRGIYLTPNDLLDRTVALEERYGLSGGVETFTASHDGPTADDRLATRYWDLPAIDAAYGGFVAEWQPRLDRYRSAGSGESGGPPAGDPPSDATCFAEKTRLVHAFRKFLFIDPGLPQELLPERWSGGEARRTFSTYYHLLNEGALRFFEGHYRPAPGHEGDLPGGRQTARRDPFRPPLSTA